MSLQVDGTTDTIRDTNLNEIVKLTGIASAVNQPELKNSIAASPVEVAASGDDTNIDIRFSAKGTGGIQLNSPLKGAANPIKIKTVTRAMADANQTLGATDYDAFLVETTGALTAGRDLILPLVAGALYIVYNNCTGFAVTFKASSGTGIAVAVAKHAMIRCDGTNYLRVTGDA